MSRRYGLRGRAPKTALPQYVLGELQCAVLKLASKLLATNPSPNLSHHNMVDMFAPREHRDMLKQAPLVAKLSYGRYREEITVCFSTIGTVKFTTQNIRHDTPYLPKAASPQPDADPELMNAVTSWVTWRKQVGVEFGRVRRLITRLDEELKSPRQVRYVWPSVLTLMRASSMDEVQELAKELEEFKASKSLPPVSAEMREACRKCSTTIVASTLLDEADNQHKGPDVIIHPTLAATEEPWLGKFEAM